MNFKKIGVGLAAAVAVTSGTVLAESPAEAATLNLAGSNTVNFLLNYTNAGGISGLNVAATAGIQPGIPSRVVRNSSGLGVSLTGVTAPAIGAIPEINSPLGLAETLNLEFSQTVKLLSATFSNVDNGDEFKLLVGGSNFISAAIPSGLTFSFSPSPEGTLFGFTVDDGNDDYFLNSIEFTPIESTPIPTPALLPGLIGMGVAALRKRKREEAVAEQNS